MSLTRKENTDLSTIDMDTYSALKNSLYPGAQDESIAMVLSYCKARGLDPLQKPVHIVPMSVKDSKTNKYEYRDVVMPGIGLYRIQAQRSGFYAGQTDPEFGEDITETLSGVTITYPKWCKITVKKQMPNGQLVEFSAKEFWKENYATAGKDTIAPNAMWKKRPYAQLAKCAEAQALRKAFPDILDQSPTAEEMEGKTFDGEIVERKSTTVNANELNEKLGLLPQYDMSELCKSINDSENLLALEISYKAAYKTAKNNPEHLNVLVELKDKRKSELDKQKQEADDFMKEYDSATGEVKQ